MEYILEMNDLLRDILSNTITESAEADVPMRDDAENTAATTFQISLIDKAISELDRLEKEADELLEEFNPSPKPQIYQPLILDGSRPCSPSHNVPKNAQVYQPLIVDGSRPCTANDTRPFVYGNIDLIKTIRKDVAYEFGLRRRAVRDAGGQSIHHFNWFGEPVYRHSSTPPEVSLWFMLTEPKVPPYSDKTRISLILRRASLYIDPVIVSLDHGIEELNRDAFDLISYARGRTHKFYTSHGWWRLDERQLDDETVVDHGFHDIYLNDKHATGSGYVKHSNIRSQKRWRDERLDLIDEQYRAAKRRSRRSKRDARPFKESPLKQSMTPEQLEDETETIPAQSSELCCRKLFFGWDVITYAPPISWSEKSSDISLDLSETDSSSWSSFDTEPSDVDDIKDEPIHGD